ncbi:MAG: DUF1849 family protein [Proteobacteria bacterium]|nr:DUF1849 family protein [Pseudomonadota bacterium]
MIGLAGLAFAAPTDIDTTKASLPSTDIAKPIAAPEALAPHRALYNVKLGASRNGGHVSGITGKMFFSIADDCHDWNIEQKMQVRFYYSEGEVSDNLSDLISREAKDGSSYYFYSRRKSDKDAAEVLRGEATLTPDANGAGIGKAVYKGEKEKQISFNVSTLFPVHHTMELLKQARAGKKFFSTDVFDGADDAGYNQISAFIGESVKGDSGKATKAKSEGKDAATDALTARQGWPIRMAFFAPDNERGSPDYEMDMLLLDNGVIKSMRVDYGDFSMSAELVKAEPLPVAKCAAPPLPPS